MAEPQGLHVPVMTLMHQAKEFNTDIAARESAHESQLCNACDDNVQLETSQTYDRSTYHPCLRC